MSRGRFLSTTFLAGVHDVGNAIPVLAWPFPYDDNAAASGFELSNDRMAEWWFRLRGLSLAYSYTTTGAGTFSGTVTAMRRIRDAGTDIAANAEIPNLLYPGGDIDEDAEAGSPEDCAQEFTGTDSQTGWNADPASTLLTTATVRLCYLGGGDGARATDGLDLSPRYIRLEKKADGIWVPGVAVYLDTFVTTPGSSFGVGMAGFDIRTAFDPGNPGAPYRTGSITFNADFLTALDGGQLGITCVDDGGVGITSASLTVTADEWFEWRDSAGLNPIWNSATGAALLDHRQP